MNNICGFYSVFALIAFIVAVLLNEINIYEIGLLLLSYILVGAMLVKFPIRKNPCKYALLLIYYISVVFLPTFHLVTLSKSVPQAIDYNRTLSMGIKVFFVTICAFYTILILLKGRNRIKEKLFFPRPVSLAFLKGTLFFMFLLTSYSYSIGLGKMGQEAVVLPFHLGGVINILRTPFYPYFFAIVVENNIMRGIKIPRMYFLLFGVWTLFEVFARMSKGIILSNFILLLPLLYLYYKPSFKKVISVMTPLVISFLLLYPIISIMRHMESGSLIENIKEARTESSSRDDDESSIILTPLNREFMTASQFMEDYDYINHNSLLDFSKALSILLSGGSAAYQTYVIDGFSTDSNHSSGTTGIMDPLLIGGYGLLFISIFVIMYLAGVSERLFLARKYSSFIMILLIIMSFSITENISTFFNGVGIQYILAQLVAIYFANKYNYRIKQGNTAL